MAKTGFFRSIILVLILAASAFFYVHQQVEIVKEGFIINKNAEELSFLLDQYRSLVYNLSRLESPEEIESALSVNEIVLCMPVRENAYKF